MFIGIVKLQNGTRVSFFGKTRQELWDNVVLLFGADFIATGLSVTIYPAERAVVSKVLNIEAFASEIGEVLKEKGVVLTDTKNHANELAEAIDSWGKQHDIGWMITGAGENINARPEE
jgi:hypothetical protein